MKEIQVKKFMEMNLKDRMEPIQEAPTEIQILAVRSEETGLLRDRTIKVILDQAAALEMEMEMEMEV